MSGAPGLVPLPASITATPGGFELTATTRFAVDEPAREVTERFADALRRRSGLPLPVARRGTATTGNVSIALDVGEGVPESYSLSVHRDGITIGAADVAGAFRALTTLRQLLPAAVETDAAGDGPWTVPGVGIADGPRFAYRGLMLDVARHFFPVDVVVRLLDQMALLKLNVLHLHLTDDQGWRLPVPGWPRLTEIGGDGDVDGGRGGWYREAEIATIVAAAAERFITVVPEIDLPGHSTAALRSYPDLGADGVAPEPYHRAGISTATLARSATTSRFVTDVIAAATRLFPGPFLHLGGDEAEGTDPAEYDRFVAEACRTAVRADRRPIVWHEGARAELPPGAIVQYWGFPGQPLAGDLARRAVAVGHRLIASPADRVYLDMRYDESTPHGLSWAGHVPVEQSYDWDPAELLDGVAEDDVLGVEAPMWTETTATPEALDMMIFPRLAGVAEIAWSPRHGRSWAEYRGRLARLAERWDAHGIGYLRSPDETW